MLSSLQTVSVGGNDLYSNSMWEGLKAVSLPAVLVEAFCPSEITHSVCTFDGINHKSTLPC